MVFMLNPEKKKFSSPVTFIQILQPFKSLYKSRERGPFQYQSVAEVDSCGEPLALTELELA